MLYKMLTMPGNAAMPEIYHRFLTTVAECFRARKEFSFCGLTAAWMKSNGCQFSLLELVYFGMAPRSMHGLLAVISVEI